MGKSRDFVTGMGTVAVISIIWLLGSWSVSHHALALGVDHVNLPNPTRLLFRWVDHWWVLSALSFIVWVDILRRKSAKIGYVAMAMLVGYGLIGFLVGWLILGLTLPMVPLAN